MGRVLGAVLTLMAGVGLVPAIAQPVWEPLGPAGGDRFMVKISPANNSTLFVMGFSAIHRSRDSAENWTRLDRDLMSSDRFADIAFKGSSSRQLFVAGNFRGVWFSDDEGDTWEQRSTGLPPSNIATEFLPVSSVAVATNGAVFAGIANEFGPVNQGAVHRSDNNGLSWTPDSVGIAQSGADKTVTLLSQDASRRLWVAVYGAGVYEYTGAGWTNRNGNLPVAAQRCTYLAHHPNQPDHLLLGTEDAWAFRSTNRGQTWTELSKPASVASLQVPPLVYLIVIDPNNPNFIMMRASDFQGGLEAPLFNPRAAQVDGAGLYISYDGAASWQLAPFLALRMAVDPSATVNTPLGNAGPVTRSRVWYGTSGGTLCLIRSTDGLATLEPKINNLDALYVNTIYAHPAPPPGYASLIYAATEEGLWLLSNGVARAWARAPAGTSQAYTWSFSANHADPREVFYSVGHPAWDKPQSRGVYRVRLSDFGNGHSPGDFQLLSNTGVWKVVTTPVQPDWIYAACQLDGVLVSRDGGTSWQPERTGLPQPASVTDLLLDTSGEPAFASLRTSNGNPYLSNNPWIPRPNENGSVYRFDVTNRVWSQINGLNRAVYGLHYRRDVSPPRLYAASGRGVYRYTEPGGWTLVSPDLVATSVLSEPDNPSILFASSAIGVFRTVNAGVLWDDISEGLLVRFTSAITRDPLDGTLYAATIGGSAARLFGATGNIAGLTPNPSTVAFGSVAVNQRRQRNVSITNSGDGDLVLTSITPTDFTLRVDSAPPFPVVIPPGDAINVTLSFTPTGTTPLAAGFTIIGNASNTPFTLPAAGQGYTETGTLAVMVDPPEGSWTATLPWGAVTTRVGAIPPVVTATGSYTIVWNALEGLVTPTNQSESFFLEAGEARTVSGLYRLPEPGVVALAIETLSVSETAGTARVNVVRTDASVGPARVDYATAGLTATPGADFAAASGTLFFADGVTNLVLDIPVMADGALEPTETFTITLSNPQDGATLLSPTQAVISILDATGGLLFTVSQVVVEEAPTNLSVFVQRTGGTGGAVSAFFFTSNNTALAGLDYVATNGTLNWANGADGTRALQVRVLNDLNPEPEKFFTVHLTSQALLVATSMTVVITDADLPTTTSTSTTSTTSAPPPPFGTLGAALEQTSLAWSAGGNAGWYGQTAVSQDGVDAARSGVIGHNQQSSLETVAIGPTSLGFWWRLSAETNDTLTFTINGTSQIQAGGEQAWRWSGFTLGAGSHTLRWTYTKNATGLAGSDAAWVDSVSLGLFGAARPLGGGWYFSEWYGYFTPSLVPWMYHAEHGYHYFFGTDPENAAFFDNTQQAYFWTSRSYYPYMYRYADGRWLWYLPGSKNPRSYLNLNNNTWETHP